MRKVEATNQRASFHFNDDTQIAMVHCRDIPGPFFVHNYRAGTTTSMRSKVHGVIKHVEGHHLAGVIKVKFLYAQEVPSHFVQVLQDVGQFIIFEATSIPVQDLQEWLVICLCKSAQAKNTTCERQPRLFWRLPGWRRRLRILFGALRR